METITFGGWKMHLLCRITNTTFGLFRNSIARSACNVSDRNKIYQYKLITSICFTSKNFILDSKAKVYGNKIIKSIFF